MKEIILSSGHPLLIAGFRTVIEATEEFTLSVCGDLQHLREISARDPVSIILGDVAFGFTLDLLREIREKSPRSAVILWVDTVSTEFISQALSLGVLGVLRKSATAELCIECLRHVAKGELWVENELSKRLLRTRTIKLTPRERQLMEMLAQGRKNKEIAFLLGITEGTVKVYLSHLYEKVGASDRFELALLALRNMATDEQDVLSVTTRAGNSPYLMPVSVRFEKLVGHTY